MRQQFLSDNNAGICPEALAAMISENEAGQQIGYGDDPTTRAVVTRLLVRALCLNGRAAEAETLAIARRSLLPRVVPPADRPKVGARVNEDLLLAALKRRVPINHRQVFDDGNALPRNFARTSAASGIDKFELEWGIPCSAGSRLMS